MGMLLLIPKAVKYPAAADVVFLLDWRFDFSLLAPKLCLRLHANPPQITYLHAVSTRGAGGGGGGEGLQNFHWTDPGWLEIFHITTSGTSCYISRVFAYSEKNQERAFNPSSALGPRALYHFLQHLQTSTDKPTDDLYLIIAPHFPFRLSSPRPGVPAGRWQPDHSLFLPADGPGSSQRKAEHPGQWRSGWNTNQTQSLKNRFWVYLVWFKSRMQTHMHRMWAD